MVTLHTVLAFVNGACIVWLVGLFLLNRSFAAKDVLWWVAIAFNVCVLAFNVWRVDVLTNG